ncbi:hypothetical protein ABT124_01900 [Streptomyces sp. NPDC001982]|uniref:hypothetical protein n=1 Tax=unclassified Streptomyces TaxID=2593676 RepID=UPI003316BE47
MYGHGAVPPHRSDGTVITLRVLIAASGFLSCGILACVPLFRVAFLRGRSLDWLVAWLSVPVSITCFAVIGALPETDPRTDVALAVILILGAAASAYFLAMDIRHRNTPRPPAGYAPPHAHTVPTPYGYQQPAPPYQGTPAPQPPVAQDPHPMAQTYIPAPPPPQNPPPQRPAPARIDQVRAELDELSDYLRRHDGKHGGDHEGGR